VIQEDKTKAAEQAKADAQHTPPPPLHTTYDEMIVGLFGWGGTMEMEMGASISVLLTCVFAQKKKTIRTETKLDICVAACDDSIHAVRFVHF
jgi:hypothetical protein